MNENLDPAHFPRVVAITGGAARVTRCDATDIAFDRGAGTTLNNFMVEYPAQAVLPIVGFDPETAEEWPSDATIAAAINADANSAKVP